MVHVTEKHPEAETPFPAEIFLRSEAILGVHFGNGEAGVSGCRCPAPRCPEPVRRREWRPGLGGGRTHSFFRLLCVCARGSLCQWSPSASRAGGPAQSLPRPAGARGLGRARGVSGLRLPRQVGKGRPPPRVPSCGLLPATFPPSNP